MAYPPAPGTTGSSLPPKPPAPAAGANSNPNTIGLGGGFTKKSSFKPTFSSNATPSYPAKPPQSSTYSGAPGSYGAPPVYTGSAAPTPPPAAQYGAPPYSQPHATHGAVSQPAYSNPQPQSWHQQQQPPSNWRAPQQQQQPQHHSYNQPSSQAAAGPQSYAPQTYGTQGYGQGTSYGGQSNTQNPYSRQAGPQSAPVGLGGEYAHGSDEAAQIAQWQSAYAPRGPAPAWDKDGKPVEQDESAETSAYMQAANNNLPENPDKKKTVYRKGGGKSWQDDSLLDWDPAHFRLFVGNLAGETTDDSLLKAFARWPSVQKARVIRDKRTSKSKGYGFVSLSDADQFFEAAREMNGKYIQSHPVTIKRANTEIKSANVKDKKKGYKNNNHNHHNGSGNGNGYGGANTHGQQKRDGESPGLGPKPGNGIVKPGKKMKNGLKLLG